MLPREDQVCDALFQVRLEASHRVGEAPAEARDQRLASAKRRLMARRGRKKATVAVGHTILVIAYWLLTRPDLYHELGSTYFDERDRTRVQRRLVHRLEALGYSVQLTPHAA